MSSAPDCPGLGSWGRSPSILDLDLEQLFRGGQGICLSLTSRAQKQPLEKPGETTFSPALLVPATSRRPRFYPNHRNWSFISPAEVFSSGSFYAVFAAHHLSAPPDSCGAQTEGGAQTPPVALQTEQNSPRSPLGCLFPRGTGLFVFTPCATIFCIYTLVLHSFIDWLFYK